MKRIKEPGVMWPGIHFQLSCQKFMNECFRYCNLKLGGLLVCFRAGFLNVIDILGQIILCGSYSVPCGILGCMPSLDASSSLWHCDKQEQILDIARWPLWRHSWPWLRIMAPEELEESKGGLTRVGFKGHCQLCRIEMFSNKFYMNPKVGCLRDQLDFHGLQPPHLK